MLNFLGWYWAEDHGCRHISFKSCLTISRKQNPSKPWCVYPCFQRPYHLLTLCEPQFIQNQLLRVPQVGYYSEFLGFSKRDYTRSIEATQQAADKFAAYFSGLLRDKGHTFVYCWLVTLIGPSLPFYATHHERYLREGGAINEEEMARVVDAAFAAEAKGIPSGLSRAKQKVYRKLYGDVAYFKKQQSGTLDGVESQASGSQDLDKEHKEELLRNEGTGEHDAVVEYDMASEDLKATQEENQLDRSDLMDFTEEYDIEEDFYDMDDVTEEEAAYMVQTSPMRHILVYSTDLSIDSDRLKFRIPSRTFDTLLRKTRNCFPPASEPSGQSQ